MKDKLVKLKELLGAAKRVTVLTGAGISTSSGLPDFRGENGFYLNEYDVESVISKSFFQGNPKVFWKAFKEIFQLKLEEDLLPNYGHYFLRELERSGKEVSVFTQNVDGLHYKARSSKVFEMHGNVRMAKCPKCKVEYDIEYINSYDIPRCIRQNSKGVTCNFILKPNVVLFGEKVHHYNEAIESIYDSDLLLVIGTSLEVYPVNQIPNIFKNAPLINKVLITNERTQYDNLFDLVINDDINRTLSEIDLY